MKPIRCFFGSAAVLTLVLGSTANAQEADVPSETEPSPAKPVAAEPSAAGRSTTEPSETEPSPAKPVAAEPSAAGQSTTEPSAAEPSATGWSATERSAVEASAAGRSAAGPTAADASATGPSAAEQSAKRMDLNQAMGLALSRHPRLVAARHQTSSAEAQVGVARSRYYPQVHVWMQYLRGTENGNLAIFHSVPGVPRIGGSRRDGVGAYDSFNNYHAALTVHQLLHDFGRTQGAVSAQKALVEAAKMNERLVEQAVLFGVTRAYYEVLAAQEAARVADEALMRTERLLELAAAGQAAGLRQPSEKARAEADVATAEVAKIEAYAALDVARAQFVNSLGLTDASFEPAGEEPAHPANMVEAEAVAVALRNRPELKALDLQRQAMNERLRSINAGHYPRIEAIGVLQSRGQFLGGEQFDYGANNWSAGVVVNVPIFQGYLITEQANAVQAEVQAIESGREAIRQAVIMEVKRALAQVRSADEAENAALKAVEAAKVALDTSEGRYRTGLASLVEMTDAQSVYISALSGAVRASYNRRFARAALDLATGSFGKQRGPSPHLPLSDQDDSTRPR